MTIRKFDNFSLRYVSDDDHCWLVELHNDQLTLRNVTNPTTIDLKSHMNWWKNKIECCQTEKRLIFCVNDEKVGFCKFYNIDKNNNNCILGADIHPRHRGKGYAITMWKLMLDYCFDKTYPGLSLHRVSLTTADYNDIAKKVYKKLGFLEEGRHVQSLFRDNEYYDEICMYMLKTNWICE